MGNVLTQKYYTFPLYVDVPSVSPGAWILRRAMVVVTANTVHLLTTQRAEPTPR